MIIDVGEIVGAAEIGRMLNVGRQRVNQLVGRADFPAPYAELEMGRIWLTRDVRAWAEGRGRTVIDPFDEADAPESL